MVSPVGPILGEASSRRYPCRNLTAYSPLTLRLCAWAGVGVNQASDCPVRGAVFADILKAAVHERGEERGLRDRLKGWFGT